MYSKRFHGELKEQGCLARPLSTHSLKHPPALYAACKKLKKLTASTGTSLPFTFVIDKEWNSGTKGHKRSTATNLSLPLDAFALEHVVPECHARPHL